VNKIVLDRSNKLWWEPAIYVHKTTLTPNSFPTSLHLFRFFFFFLADSAHSPSHSEYSKQIRGTYYLYPGRIYSSPKPLRDLQGQQRYLCKDSQPEMGKTEGQKKKESIPGM